MQPNRLFSRQFTAVQSRSRRHSGSRIIFIALPFPPSRRYQIYFLHFDQHMTTGRLARFRRKLRKNAWNGFNRLSSAPLRVRRGFSGRGELRAVKRVEISVRNANKRSAPLAFRTVVSRIASIAHNIATLPEAVVSRRGIIGRVFSPAGRRLKCAHTIAHHAAGSLLTKNADYRFYRRVLSYLLVGSPAKSFRSLTCARVRAHVRRIRAREYDYFPFNRSLISTLCAVSRELLPPLAVICLASARNGMEYMRFIILCEAARGPSR